MVRKTRAQRIAAARISEIERKMRRALSLSERMCTVLATWEAYHEGMTRLLESAVSDDKLVANVSDRVRNLVIDDFARVRAMLGYHTAGLYSVIERWTNWGFEDAMVDALLKDEARVRRLKEYRHTVFHLSEFDDQAVFEWAQDESNARWTSELRDALCAAILDWNRHGVERLTQKMVDDLERNGSR